MQAKFERPGFARGLFDIQQLLSKRRTVTELWSSPWLHIRFSVQLNSPLERALVHTPGIFTLDSAIAIFGRRIQSIINQLSFIKHF